MMHTEEEIAARTSRIAFMARIRLRGWEQGREWRRSREAGQASKGAQVTILMNKGTSMSV